LINIGTPTLIYTGVYPETQCLAIPTSGDLITWRKRKQPIIPSAPQGMQLEGFRDPYVWQEAGEWRMIVGSGLTDVGGAVLIYRSKNLIDWRYMESCSRAIRARPIHFGREPCGVSFIVPLGEKWILIVSVHSHEGAVYSIYYTGQYTVDRFIPDGPPRLLDGGAEGCFYAPQTFSNGKANE
jgi:beta-fructofuranosidase